MTDVRESLPSYISTNDMKATGTRSCYLFEYGFPFAGDEHGERTIANIFKSWKVIDSFDIDVYEDGKSAPCDKDCSRRFMLKFLDGIWRYASFGGMSGEPMAYCQWEGVTCTHGKVAYVVHRIRQKEKCIDSLNAQLRVVQEELKDLQNKLDTARG